MSARSTLQEYYEQNTTLFLLLGGGKSTYSLHRAVWGEGVTTTEGAFAYPYHLVARVLQAVPTEKPAQVLDLGCGVGGGVLYLAENAPTPLSATGITLSAKQVKLAQDAARDRGVADRCTFRQGNFLDLPALGPVDLAYAIEAFVHATDPERFFQQAAQVIRPGGRLVVIDDVLADGLDRASLSERERSWIDTFRAGWQAEGLRPLGTVQAMARAHGFRGRDNRDLTPHLDLDRPRDRLIAWSVVPLRPLLWRWSYFRGLIGGHALQQCLKSGLVRFRCLVFERQAGA